MSAATRAKNRKRQHASEDPITETLRKINSSGKIGEDDILQLYSIDKPVCQGCRVNNKDSPNCFCGLIPPSNGVRKQGLWQKVPEAVISLGEDPNELARSSLEHPAGLTNLGATCYANSILQCLYMNTAFRNRFFRLEPELLQENVVLYQLSRLFAQLHFGKKAAVDSALFTNTLNINNGVQQDCHEFFTLLLSLLESYLSESSDSQVKSVVQDLFRGSLSHVTRCSMCGQESQASSNMEDFYALELNVKGLENLRESLDDYLSVEHLQGDNQYFCENCKGRVDATCCIKLRTLPPVLNFHLKRYVFVAKTTTRKKITSKLGFPRFLNMSKLLKDAHDNTPLIYELSAILLHRGATANSGHYVANIKDDLTGVWWEFDDESVSKLGFHPFGESEKSSNCTMGPSNKMSCPPTVSGTCDMEDPNMFSSADAYMLMYSIRNKLREPVNMFDTERTSNGSNHLDATGFSLPPHLYSEVEESNQSYIKLCEEYQTKKEEISKNITERKCEVRTLLSMAPVYSPYGSYYWIATDWLRQWSDTVSPLTIDNTNIQCQHQKVPPAKLPLMKRISPSAWSQLQNKYNGGPALKGLDYCTDCIKETAKTIVSAYSYRDERAVMKMEVEAALASSNLHGDLYFVSKSWLTQWLRRKIGDAPCEGDAAPTAALSCPHGGLRPEQAAGAKRQLLPERIWNYLLQNAMQVDPNNPLSYRMFKSDTETCAICEKDLTEEVSQKDFLRATKLEQRQRHEQLASGKCTLVIPAFTFYLIPSSWISTWKSYLNTTGRNASEEPLNLEQCIRSLLCEKHSQLFYRPPELVRKKTELVQKTSNDDVLTIITEKDWDYFCEEWNVSKDIGISATIELDDEGGCEIPIVVDDQSPNEVDCKESKVPILKTYPMVCEECIEERESRELMSKLDYTNEEIRVHFVRGKTPPKSILNASASANDPERRVSKRSRRASSSNGNVVHFKVSGSTTIYQLKMMIWESFEVVKENQKLHKGEVELADESATLADLNVFPGDVLWVSDTEIHENRDIIEEIQGQNMSNETAEEGFKGTRLASTVPAKVF